MTASSAHSSAGETAPGEFTPRSVGVVGAVLTGVFLNAASLAPVALAVFMETIASDLSWGRAELGGAVTVTQLLSGLSALIAGRFIDTLGPRRVLLPLKLISGLLLVAFLFTGKSIVLFYLLFALIGLTSPVAVPYSKMLATWFSRHRGLTMGMLGVGFMATNTLTPPAAAFLQDAVGWRGAFSVFGLVILLVAFPVLFTLFREPSRTRAGGGAAEGAVPPTAALTPLRQIVSRPAYWLVVGAIGGAGFGYLAIVPHSVAILGDRGLARDVAVLALSSFAVSGLLAQVLVGHLLDRFNTPRVVLPFALCALAGTLLMHLSGHPAAVFAGAVLFGIGCGGETSVTSYFVTRYFGVQNFSRVYGTVMPFLILFTAPAPILMGAAYDATGSYGPGLILAEIGLALSALFLFLLPSYRFTVGDQDLLAADAAPVNAPD
jgi:MFS family permease